MLFRLYRLLKCVVLSNSSPLGPGVAKLDPPSDSPDDHYVDSTGSSPDRPSVLPITSALAPPSPTLSLASVTPPIPVLPVAFPVSPRAPAPPSVQPPVLGQATLDAIVAAVDARHPRRPHSDSATNTDSSLCLFQFSPDNIKVLKASDVELQAVVQAVHSRSPAHRAALTEYWRCILDELHIFDDCLFLEEKIVIPVALREAVLT